jgi:hypothetical protein
MGKSHLSPISLLNKAELVGPSPIDLNPTADDSFKIKASF